MLLSGLTSLPPHTATEVLPQTVAMANSLSCADLWPATVVCWSILRVIMRISGDNQQTSHYDGLKASNSVTYIQVIRSSYAGCPARSGSAAGFYVAPRALNLAYVLMCLCTRASFCHSQIASEPWCLRCTVSNLFMLILILMILLSLRLCFNMLLLWMRFHPMQLTGNWFEMLWKSFLLVTSVFSLVATGFPVQNYVCV